jgi:rfaE bifunctional protein kinase chain/domain
MKNAKQAQRLRRIVESFPRLTVTALADLVADEFIFGEIARVSREAPVLILRHREQTVVPGGGANAICNLADLGVNVLPAGWVGDDQPGRLLLERLRRRRIPTGGILVLKKFSTVTKTRILAGMAHTARQQVVRVDREPQSLPPRAQQARLAAMAQKYARQSDALLLSDYGYGSATPEMLRGIEAGGIPVTLDSRYRMTEFAGVTAATPNEPEVEAALGVKIGDDDGALRRAGQALLKGMKLQSLVITRGRDGMAVFTRGRKPVHIPIHGADQVADVTGAGDTVIATFTAALAAGADAEDAARLANYAGGIVVMKRGTATVSRAELLAALESGAPSRRRTP